MAQMKMQVLAWGEVETGKGRTGNDWHRRTAQVFTGEVVGNIPYYSDKETLEAMGTGAFMVDVEPSAGDRGRLEFRITKMTPVVQAKAVA